MADRTLTGISLSDVRKLIDEKNIGGDVADIVGRLLGLVIAAAPVAGGPGLLPLWALIEPKNELIEAIKYAARKFSKSKPSEYLDRAERMAAANCLLVYAAYFDALREQRPAVVHDLGMSEEEAKKAWAAAERAPDPAATARVVADHVIALPRPADQLASDAEIRREIFFHLSRLVERQLWRLRPQDNPHLTWFEKSFVALHQRAEALYQAEYLGMAVEFQQFFVWGVLQDQAARAGQVQRLAGDQRTWFELLGRAIHGLDLGLKELAETVARLPASALTGSVRPDVREAAEGLHRTYADVLERQVIDDQFTVDDAEAPRLSFPRKLDGFVPQAYRVAVYHGKDIHLERDDAWDERAVRADIGAFILLYLESPYSVQTPLLILGHPGSGKSLLTEVLAGQLAYPAYTTVRVKLRDVDPDVSLLTQLESQIRTDTGGRSVTWADFAGGLSATPPVVILDGYDELLQATGKVFASYLDEVRQFQHQQAVQHRPVRVIVTSRLTLIDKAAVPLGTTVVKLEDFDTERRDAWCEVWNRHNGPYFERAGIRPFAVPDNEKLLELARQPLLLLMLAIYDSLGNELGSQPDIDQTLLYDSLLRRFIERELSKGQAGHEFAALPAADQADAVQREMERLGVAAIGMFNRQDVKIQREELNDDLGYFGFDRAVTTEGRALAEADLLLGSFFFIHESRSKLQDEPAGPGDGQAAFEFLHNTFGEFLAADFILRRVTEEAGTICRLSGDAMLDGTRGRQLAMLSESWFGCLVHTALHTRPVILTMLREWSGHRLGNRHRSRADMLTALDAVVIAQLRGVLNDMAIPDPDPGRRGRSRYVRLPMRGHLAVYSLNLVLLRAYLGDQNYLLAEADLGDRPDSCRPWDGLTHLWRSWFTLNSLSALAGLLTAERRGQLLEITPGWSTLIPMKSGPLCDSARTAVALADNLTAAPAILHVAPRTRMRREIFQELWRRVGPAVPELDVAADTLALKMFAPNGDELRGLSRGFFAYLVDPLSVEYVDVASRLTRTPIQWREVEVAWNSLVEFSSLSRYEAEATVDALATLEPRWLPFLMRVSERGEWDQFLWGPAAAPVLRAAVREFDRWECCDVAGAAVESLRLGIEPFDVDTASALAVLGFLGGGTDLCARALDVIMDRCERGAWRLLDIPVETWDGLAGVFRSADPELDARRGRFVVLLESAVAESIEGEGFRAGKDRDLRALAPFWVQALRIGADGKKDTIFAALDKALVSDVLTSRERTYLLALVGWARETGDDIAPVLSMVHRAGDGGWLKRFLLPSESWNPGSVDEDMVARMLTHKEALDLRWALGLLRQEDQAKAGRRNRRNKA
jgi:hypothetical protein